MWKNIAEVVIPVGDEAVSRQDAEMEAHLRRGGCAWSIVLWLHSTDTHSVFVFTIKYI